MALTSWAMVYVGGRVDGGEVVSVLRAWRVRFGLPIVER